MTYIPTDLRKTHKIARRALARAKESARMTCTLPDDSKIKTPARDRKAWHRLGLRAVMLACALLTIPPAMARGGGNHGHHSSGSGAASSAITAYHSRMTGE